jgi:outer membrane protein assembly factor BamB
MSHQRRRRALVVIAAFASLASAAPAVGAPVQLFGDEAWVNRHDPAEGSAFGFEPLISPDGAVVYAIGMTTTDVSSSYRVVALDSATGDELWVAERPGSTHASALSTDGDRIYLAGTVRSGATRQDWSVHALDTADGSEVWSTPYLQPGRRDTPADIEVSPDGERVYVTGRSLEKRRHSYDFTTLALVAQTGAEDWATRYDRQRAYDEAIDVAVDPLGSRVYVTGMGTLGEFNTNIVTLAYDARTGEQEWETQEGGPRKKFSYEFPAAVLAGGGRVYVTGQSTSGDGDPDWLTVGYRASTGRKLWGARYDRRPGDKPHEHAYSMALSPQGRRVYVTGDSQRGRNDAVTISYRAQDGSRDWLARFDGPAGKNDLGWDVVASPDRQRVYVTVQSVGETPNEPDFVTLGYSAFSGELEWSARYGEDNGSMESFPTVAVHPDSTRVFVVGREQVQNDHAFTTIAYEPSSATRPPLPARTTR